MKFLRLLDLISLTLVLILASCGSLDFHVQYIFPADATATSQASLPPSPAVSTPTIELLFDTETSFRSTPSPQSMSTTTPIEVPYCETLANDYVPAEGFKVYCDKRFEFAFEYPIGWEIDHLDDVETTTNPFVYLQALIFHGINYSNIVRVYTWAMPETSSLDKVVKNHWAYESREFKKEYSPMWIGGKPAYGFVNRSDQDYSGVTLFFEHGDYYTTMELKIITADGLDVNWQIAHSIQTTGNSPADNVFSEELIEDSYRLLR